MSGPREATASGLRLVVHTQPRASKSALAGRHGDALKIRVAAPPVDGAANRELLRFLGELLEIPAARIELATGLGSRRKVVLISGTRLDQAARKLGLTPPEP